MEKIKGLFSTPKRTAVTILVLLLIMIVVGVIALFAEVYWDMNEDRFEYAIEEKIRNILY